MPSKYSVFIITCLLLISQGFTIAYAKHIDNTRQKEIAPAGRLNQSGLQIKSIDTQIVSKHWQKTDRESIKEQVSMLRDLGANFIAISTPYDRPEELTIWADEIHKAGLSVWFRSHWLNWEGDEDHSSNMTAHEYLTKTTDFIESHPVLFKEGDAFTMCVEPEQVFTARKETVFDWYSYNKFLIDQIDYSDHAFSNIGLSGKIHTNWISMNGWVVENGLNAESVKKMGLITVDHYPDQEEQNPAKMAESLVLDLTRMHEKWQVPIILGEWGYNIQNNVSEEIQNAMISEVLHRLKELDFLVGFNYWTHLGGSSNIIDDQNGSNFSYRTSALKLQKFFQAD
jgi:hypothetical protein